MKQVSKYFTFDFKITAELVIIFNSICIILIGLSWPCNTVYITPLIQVMNMSLLSQHTSTQLQLLSCFNTNANYSNLSLSYCSENVTSQCLSINFTVFCSRVPLVVRPVVEVYLSRSLILASIFYVHICGPMIWWVQVHLNKLECREKVHFFL